MFLRIKNIKGKEYAYRVKNKWTEKGARQKVVGYLGRLHRLELKNESSFENFVSENSKMSYDDYMRNMDFNTIVMNLITWEILRHGGIEKKENIFDFGDFKAELGNMSVSSSGREIVLRMNEGYLCKYTLKNIFGIQLGEEQEPGMDFAHALVNAGLNVPQEVFVKLYERIT